MKDDLTAPVQSGASTCAPAMAFCPACFDAVKIEEMYAEAADARRFQWYFSDKPKGEWLMTYLDGMKAGWTTDQWRAAIDAAAM